MKYARLGSSGLMVSKVVLGAASFGDTVRPEFAKKVVEAALDAGITTFDTADVYAGGLSEEVLGQSLPPSRRDQIILCSKVGLRVGDTDAEHGAELRGTADRTERWARGIAPTDAGLSRKHIVAAVESSLRKLGTDYLDLYQVHRFDNGVPLEETLAALDDLVRSGKVRYLGCSGFAAWQLYRALWLSERDRRSRFESIQVRYNVGWRDPESELIPACREAGVGILAFQVLAGGILMGRTTGGGADSHHRSSRPAVAGAFGDVRFTEGAVKARELCTRAGVAPAQALLGWVLSQRGVNAAVIGASTPSQLAESIAAVDAELPEDLLSALDQLSET